MNESEGKIDLPRMNEINKILAKLLKEVKFETNRSKDS